MPNDFNGFSHLQFLGNFYSSVIQPIRLWPHVADGPLNGIILTEFKNEAFKLEFPTNFTLS
jgi:hypothetical protein